MNITEISTPPRLEIKRAKLLSPTVSDGDYIVKILILQSSIAAIDERYYLSTIVYGVACALVIRQMNYVTNMQL